ncbi:MAG: hypothetical protein PHX61_07185 [Alphaproteobacteria bacterium]|nr:hypothetical protein [Alphaproteobacteria bacterium]
MKLRVGIYISGEAFDPYAFNNDLPVSLRGIAEQHKNNKTYYWSSAELVVLENTYAEDSLYDLILKYGEHLTYLSDCTDIKKYAFIYGYVKDAVDLHGFFINKKLLKICNDLALEIDIGLCQQD